jgi:hypothetical protein
MGEEELWNVEKILRKMVHNGETLYETKWYVLSVFF